MNIELGQLKSQLKHGALVFFRCMGRLPNDLMSVSVLAGILCLVFAQKVGLIPSEYVVLLHLVLPPVLLYYLAVTVGQLVSAQPQGNNAFLRGVSKPSLVNSDELDMRAVHEAGHIVTLSAFSRRPGGLRAYIERDSSKAIGGELIWDTSLHKGRLEHFPAERLVSLGGYKAEQILRGRASDGSSGDFCKYEELVKRTLNAHSLNYTWFRVPETGLEVQVNAETIAKIQQHDFLLVEQLIKDNQALVREIADALLEKVELSHGEVNDFVNRVNVSALMGLEPKPGMA